MKSRKEMPWILKKLTRFAILLFCNQLFVAPQNKLEREVSFNQDYVTVAVTPYVKLNWAYDSYTIEDIKEMLDKIASRFTKIFVPSIGVNENHLGSKWNATYSVCLIATAAAQMNRAANRLLLKVSQGIDLENSDVRVRTTEIENAFTSTKIANEIYPGTVSSVVYCLYGSNITVEVMKVFDDGRLKTNKLGLKLGTMITDCQHIITSDFRWHDNASITTFIKHLDFLICDEITTPNDWLYGPTSSVKGMDRRFRKYSDAFRHARASVSVSISRLQWPSKAVENEPDDSSKFLNIENMYKYWTIIGKWASKNRVEVILHDAFDQPWRPKRYSHSGWWKFAGDDNIHTYVEKALEPPAEDMKFKFPSENVTSNKTVTPSWMLSLSITLPLSVLVAITIGAVYLYRLKARKILSGRLTKADIQEFIFGSDTTASGNKILQTEENSNNTPYNREYELSKAQIRVDQSSILGQGQFGIIFKGQIERNGEFLSVAFKTIKDSSTVQQMKSLLAEIKLLIYIGSHPNIIELIGAYTEEIQSGLVYLVVEYCGKGSLEILLRRSFVCVRDDGSNQSLSQEALGDNGSTDLRLEGFGVEKWDSTKEPITKRRLNEIATQIAKGMNYLSSKKVMHGDLAARNVLVADDDTIRLTDFGLSRRLYEYTSYVKASQEPLPWRWMAIESLSSLNFSSQSDVWSFGVTLWEIYSLGNIPYPGLHWDITFVQKLEQGLRNTAPRYAQNTVYDKMLQCWALKPSRRPNFKELEEFFERISSAGTVTDYI